MPGSKGRPKSLILDLYGAYIRRLGGWMAVSNLITLMGQLGVDEQAVRSAVSRLTWMGFGMVANGVWMAPHRMLPELRDTVRRLEFERYVHVFDGTYGGFEELERLVRRCWDLYGLRA